MVEINGKNGDGHLFTLRNNSKEGGQQVQFMQKEVVDGEFKLVKDGVTNEEVLMMMCHRLDFLYEKLPDVFTRTARWHVGQAIGALGERTKERKGRGVEGMTQA